MTTARQNIKDVDVKSPTVYVEEDEEGNKANEIILTFVLLDKEESEDVDSRESQKILDCYKENVKVIVEVDKQAAENNSGRICRGKVYSLNMNLAGQSQGHI